jgi:hypothetical protein
LKGSGNTQAETGSKAKAEKREGSKRRHRVAVLSLRKK